MGLLDTPLRRVAQTVVPKFGTTTGSIERKGAVDAENQSAGSDTSYTCSVAFSDVEAGLIDGGLVKQGDRLAIIPAADLSITPNPKTDRLMVGSDSWQIVRVMTAQPGTTAIAYELVVRR